MSQQEGCSGLAGRFTKDQPLKIGPTSANRSKWWTYAPIERKQKGTKGEWRPDRLQSFSAMADCNLTPRRRLVSRLKDEIIGCWWSGSGRDSRFPTIPILRLVWRTSPLLRHANNAFFKVHESFQFEFRFACMRYSCATIVLNGCYHFYTSHDEEIFRNKFITSFINRWSTNYNVSTIIWRLFRGID